jgi:hypothetical protein
MNVVTRDLAIARQDQFGRRVAARLDATLELPHDISERLRAARTQALAHRKAAALQTATSVNVSAGGQATLGGDPRPGWLHLAASALPLIVLLAGLVTIHVVQKDTRARELADVDAALLTDDLPPAAYADPGFVQFLKTNP